MLGFKFSELWSRHSSKVPVSGLEQQDRLTYDQIPRCSERALLHLTYPQVHGVPVQPQSVRFFCRRYADELHSLLDALPLKQTEIDRLLMPLVKSVIDWVNVLPASEFHHHAGSGGLFVHSVQCAVAAVSSAETLELGHSSTLEERYHNKQRWIVAAAVMGLLHDVGKIFDMEVLLDDGVRWNPFQESFAAWSHRLKVRQFYVVWRQGRSHKQHELRSVRLMAHLMNAPLIEYLTTISGDEILGAMEDAVVLGTGPLAEVLRKAEEASINKDAQDRQRIGAGLSRTSSPVLVPLLQSMNALIDCGQWTVNRDNSRVFVTNCGTFIALTDTASREVHDKACQLLSPYVPATSAGIIRVLSEGAVIVANEEEDEDVKHFWSLMVHEGKKRLDNCIKVRDPFLLFQDTPLPKALSARLLKPSQRQDQEHDQRAELWVMAPQTSFMTLAELGLHLTNEKQEKISRETMSTDVPVLTHEEVQSNSTRTMTAAQAKDFIPRLLNTVRQQMLCGEGFLIDNLRRRADGNLVCSARKAEMLLKSRGINEKSMEVLFRLKMPPSTLRFDREVHEFILPVQTNGGDDGN